MIEKNYKNRQVAKISIFITSVFIIFLSVAYAFTNQILFGTKRQVITTGNLEVNFKEGKELSLSNALPMEDEVGMIQEPFTFEVKNNEVLPFNYRVKLVRIPNENELALTNVKYHLVREGKSAVDLVSNIVDGVIDSNTIEPGETIEYNLRLWINNGVTDEEEISGKSLSVRIDIEVDKKPTDLKVVEFDTGDTETLPDSKKVIIGTPYGEMPGLTKTGYNFLGWYNEKDQPITADTIAREDDGVIRAKWEAKKYLVTIDASQYGMETKTLEVTYGSDYDVYKAGYPSDIPDTLYTLDGYFTEKEGGTQVFNTTKVNITDNQTLYLRYRLRYLYEASITAGDGCEFFHQESRWDADYLSGNCTGNYVSYSGYLWRVFKQKGYEMGMIVDDILPFSGSISRNGASCFVDTPVDQWLNNDFLSTLENYESYLVKDAKWYEAYNDSTLNAPNAETATEIIRTVGLLNLFEYTRTGGASGYLNIGKGWPLMPMSLGGVNVVGMDGLETIFRLPFNLEGENMGVRPVVYVLSNVQVASGNGSKDNPYILKSVS